MIRRSAQLEVCFSVVGEMIFDSVCEDKSSLVSILLQSLKLSLYIPKPVAIRFSVEGIIRVVYAENVSDALIENAILSLQRIWIFCLWI